MLKLVKIALAKKYIYDLPGLHQSLRKVIRLKISKYRPIYALPVFVRLFEKLITNQIYQHMNDNGYFSSEQSVFLRPHSTVASLVNRVRLH